MSEEQIDTVSTDQPVSAEEKAEIRRRYLRRGLLHVDTSDVDEQLKAERGLQRTKKMSKEALRAIERRDGVLSPEDESSLEVEVIGDGDIEVSKEEGDNNPYQAEIAAMAARTPEVRFTKAQMIRPFSDDEIKIIAAALRTNTALYRVADALHCSVRKIDNAIKSIPILTELAQEKIARRKQQAMEAVEDCVKSRVPAVVMWNAEKILPEIYGEQKNIDNEDDTKLVIGAIPEEEVEAAENEVLAASQSVPDVQVNAAMEVLQSERGAELAAAGGGVPVSPLNQIPPAPALNPPSGDPRFGQFIPAAEMNRVPVIPMPVSEMGPDNYGAVGGGFDDFDDGSWI